MQSNQSDSSPDSVQAVESVLVDETHARQQVDLELHRITIHHAQTKVSLKRRLDRERVHAEDTHFEQLQPRRTGGTSKAKEVIREEAKAQIQLDHALARREAAMLGLCTREQQAELMCLKVVLADWVQGKRIKVAASARPPFLSFLCQQQQQQQHTLLTRLARKEQTSRQQLQQRATKRRSLMAQAMGVSTADLESGVRREHKLELQQLLESEDKVRQELEQQLQESRQQQIDGLQAQHKWQQGTANRFLQVLALQVRGDLELMSGGALKAPPLHLHAYCTTITTNKATTNTSGSSQAEWEQRSVEDCLGVLFAEVALEVEVSAETGEPQGLRRVKLLVVREVKVVDDAAREEKFLDSEEDYTHGDGGNVVRSGPCPAVGDTLVGIGDVQIGSEREGSGAGGGSSMLEAIERQIYTLLRSASESSGSSNSNSNSLGMQLLWLRAGAQFAKAVGQEQLQQREPQQLSEAAVRTPLRVRLGERLHLKDGGCTIHSRGTIQSLLSPRHLSYRRRRTESKSNKSGRSHGASRLQHTQGLDQVQAQTKTQIQMQHTHTPDALTSMAMRAGCGVRAGAASSSSNEDSNEGDGVAATAGEPHKPPAGASAAAATAAAATAAAERSVLGTNHEKKSKRKSKSGKSSKKGRREKGSSRRGGGGGRTEDANHDVAVAGHAQAQAQAQATRQQHLQLEAMYSERAGRPRVDHEVCVGTVKFKCWWVWAVLFICLVLATMVGEVAGHAIVRKHNRSNSTESSLFPSPPAPTLDWSSWEWSWSDLSSAGAVLVTVSTFLFLLALVGWCWCGSGKRYRKKCGRWYERGGSSRDLKQDQQDLQNNEDGGLGQMEKGEKKYAAFSYSADQYESTGTQRNSSKLESLNSRISNPKSKTKTKAKAKAKAKAKGKASRIRASAASLSLPVKTPAADSL